MSELKNILRRLSEDELQLINESLEGELETTIDAVIDEKRSPSLFFPELQVGDILVAEHAGYMHFLKIREIDNPRLCCERVMASDQMGLYYDAFSLYRITDFKNPPKRVDAQVWDELYKILQERDQEINSAKSVAMQKLTKLFSKIYNYGNK